VTCTLKILAQVNVRSGPNTQAKVCGVLKQAAGVTVTIWARSQDNEWVRVEAKYYENQEQQQPSKQGKAWMTTDENYVKINCDFGGLPISEETTSCQ